LRIMGIDPGSVNTGVGVVDTDLARTLHVHHSVLKVGQGDFPNRLKQIFEGVSGLIHTYQPDQFAIENVFVSRNPDSALKLGQARGAAICAAVAMNKPVSEYAPRQIKQAIVGRGSADKVQIQHMISILLNLDEPPPSDAADALGVAVCHAHHYQTSQRLGNKVNWQ